MTKEEIIAKIEELKKQKAKADLDASIQDVFQHSYKICLNSVYGFSGTQFSPVFSRDYAESVTLTGQKVIKEMVRFTNACLNKLGEKTGETKEDEFVIAGDTDSTLGSSEIFFDGFQIEIEKAFDILKDDGYVDILENGTEVANAHSNTYYTQSLDGMTTIRNITRHKVKKQMYKVEIPWYKPLILTEDHSIMVQRDGKIIECKPGDVRDTDFFVVC